MKSFLREFRQFALRGNVMDLAVGVVIGTAFNTIITSLVTNVLTPPFGLLLGRVNFQDLIIPLGGTVHINYGLFIQSIITFIITAFGLFLFVRFINRMNRFARFDPAPEPPPPAAKSPELVVLEEIRDALAKQPIAP